jgi:hypothetical protein
MFQLVDRTNDPNDPTPTILLIDLPPHPTNRQFLIISVDKTKPRFSNRQFIKDHFTPPLHFQP